MTPTWLVVMTILLLGTLTYFIARTIHREITSGIPYLLFWPHPSYRNRPPNRQSSFLRWSIFGHAWGLMVCAMGTLVSVAYLLGMR